LSNNSIYRNITGYPVKHVNNTHAIASNSPATHVNPALQTPSNIASTLVLLTKVALTFSGFSDSLGGKAFPLPILINALKPYEMSTVTIMEHEKG